MYKVGVFFVEFCSDLFIVHMLSIFFQKQCDWCLFLIIPSKPQYIPWWYFALCWICWDNILEWLSIKLFLYIIFYLILLFCKLSQIVLVLIMQSTGNQITLAVNCNHLKKACIYKQNRFQKITKYMIWTHCHSLWVLSLEITFWHWQQIYSKFENWSTCFEN